MIPVIEEEGREELLSPEELKELTGAAFIPQLEFSDFSLIRDLARRYAKLNKKGELTRQQLWFGSYFKKEILNAPLPDVELRWIHAEIGWGVFARKEIKKMTFISEYTGKVRRKKRSDRKNGYCFEYVVTQGIATPYTIDAQDQGGIARYINHSEEPNLASALATFDSISHVILYASTTIAKGTQLTYDYGPDYWSCRKPPQKW